MKAVTDLKAKTMSPEVEQAFLNEYGGWEDTVAWIHGLEEGFDYLVYEGVGIDEYAHWFKEAWTALNMTPQQYIEALKASGKFHIFPYQNGTIVVLY